MAEARFDVEALLRSALTPVDPPEALSDRLERHLTELTDLAAEELAEWELGAMRDPRNWARPAIATVAGSGAAVGLVLVRTQRKRHKRRAAASGVIDLGRRTLRDLRDEAGRLFEDAARRR